jgi:hypothetical protein
MSYALFLQKHYGDLAAVGTRLLYAWHYGVKFVVRAFAYLAARGARKAERRRSVLHAWHVIRYALFPVNAE